jgi:glycosyltransferase involved in cell wall biosynthesis
LLAARAAGLRIVAWAAGEAAEIVETGRHGLLARTPRELADALVRLVTDAGLRRAMSDATETGLERFGWAAVVERRLEAYRCAIALRGDRPKKPRR